MENALTLHFKLVDYAKDLLFNSMTEEQEKRARGILEYHNKQADYLYINKKALVHDDQSNN